MSKKPTKFRKTNNILRILIMWCLSTSVLRIIRNLYLQYGGKIEKFSVIQQTGRYTQRRNFG